jgi:hypothetical protein
MAPALRASSLLRSGVWLLCVVLLLLSAIGCCSGATGTLPILPAGEPDETREARVRGSASEWTYEGGLVSLPVGCMDDLLESRESWRVYAQALRVAGRWR